MHFQNIMGDDDLKAVKAVVKRSRHRRKIGRSGKGKKVKVPRFVIPLLIFVGIGVWQPMALLIPTVMLLGAYLLLGHDRFWSPLLRGLRVYGGRRPEKAERLRRRADSLAMRWDQVLDRMPERWAGWLALPDFDSLRPIQSTVRMNPTKPPK